MYMRTYTEYGVDKLTRLHLSTFDCPSKLLSLSLSRGRERGKKDRTLQVKFAQPTSLTTLLTWRFLARPLIDEPSLDILLETIFPSVKWITNCSLYNSNWIEFKENCVLLHTIDIVIQLTCIIFDLLSSTKFVQIGKICNEKSIILSVVLKHRKDQWKVGHWKEKGIFVL